MVTQRVEDSTTRPPFQPDALLWHKLRPARLRGQRIARPRLVRLLDEAPGSATLVLAEAGFGKSTLLAQWMAGSQRPIAWISLGPTDNDPRLFLAYLIEALRTVDPHITDLTATAVLAPGVQLAQLVTGLLNDLAGAVLPVTLVLDDYHVITNPDVHDIVRALINYVPGHARLIISSRTFPPLPLARCDWRSS